MAIHGYRKDIMLCQPLDDKNLARLFSSTDFVIVQPKLDGIRGWVDISYKETDDVFPLISAEGNVLSGVLHLQSMLEAFQSCCKTVTGEWLRLDGEIYNHHIPFELISGLARREWKTENIQDQLQLQYHLFDYKSSTAQIERLATLRKVFELFQTECPEYAPYFNLVTSTPAKNINQIGELLEQYKEQGYEGVIIRHPLAVYPEKQGRAPRPWTILKWKPKLQDEYLIVSINEATDENNNLLGRAGSITCSDVEGNTFNVGMGIGFSISKAQQLFEQREELVGRMVTITYQNLTKYGVPRFGKAVDIEGFYD